jgi:hypothetical protein
METTNELRRLNLVKVDGKMYQVFSVDSCFVGLSEVGKDELCDSVDLMRVEPVELTEELLVKCGFVKTSEYLFDYQGFVFDAPNDWGNTKDYPVGIDISKTILGYNPGELIIRCLNFHTLQNMTFLITGKELEIKL